jgi:ribosomal protein S18 acetylase RimI-like enzyme
MDHYKSIVIRKAVQSDARSIAAYLFLAMEDIVYAFIGESVPEKGLAFMLHFVEQEQNQYSYENCWVVEDEGKIVAAVNVYNGADLHQLRQPVIEHIKSKYQRDFFPDDETQAGEYYVDTVGVAPTHHGQGIGTRLLQFVIDEYVLQRNQTLGLLVDDTNPGAKRLYIRLGFELVGNRIVFGKKMDHLQISGRKRSQ